MSNFDWKVVEKMWDNTTIFNGCWLYNGNKAGSNNSYGILMSNGVREFTHRISAHLFLGLNLNNLKTQANHKLECPHRNCWNPDHLYVGNQKENIADFIGSKGHRNSRKTHCKNGHEYTPENTRVTKLGSGRTFRVCIICYRISSKKTYDKKKEA